MILESRLTLKYNITDQIYLYKKRKEIALIEVGITNLDILTQVENEKTRKYDLIANEIALTYKCKVKIIPYVMTWEDLVTKCYTEVKSGFQLRPKHTSNH